MFIILVDFLSLTIHLTRYSENLNATYLEKSYVVFWMDKYIFSSIISKEKSQYAKAKSFN